MDYEFNEIHFNLFIEGSGLSPIPQMKGRFELSDDKSELLFLIDLQDKTQFKPISTRVWKAQSMSENFIIYSFVKNIIQIMDNCEKLRFCDSGHIFKAQYQKHKFNIICTDPKFPNCLSRALIILILYNEELTIIDKIFNPQGFYGEHNQLNIRINGAKGTGKSRKFNSLTGFHFMNGHNSAKSEKPLDYPAQPLRTMSIRGRPCKIKFYDTKGFDNISAVNRDLQNVLFNGHQKTGNSNSRSKEPVALNITLLSFKILLEEVRKSILTKEWRSTECVELSFRPASRIISEETMNIVSYCSLALPHTIKICMGYDTNIMTGKHEESLEKYHQIPVSDESFLFITSEDWNIIPEVCSILEWSKKIHPTILFFIPRLPPKNCDGDFATMVEGFQNVLILIWNLVKVINHIRESMINMEAIDDLNEESDETGLKCIKSILSNTEIEDKIKLQQCAEIMKKYFERIGFSSIKMYYQWIETMESEEEVEKVQDKILPINENFKSFLQNTNITDNVSLQQYPQQQTSPLTLESTIPISIPSIIPQIESTTEPINVSSTNQMSLSTNNEMNDDDFINSLQLFDDIDLLTDSYQYNDLQIIPLVDPQTMPLIDPQTMTEPQMMFQSDQYTDYQTMPLIDFQTMTEPQMMFQSDQYTDYQTMALVDPQTMPLTDFQTMTEPQMMFQSDQYTDFQTMTEPQMMFQSDQYTDYQTMALVDPQTMQLTDFQTMTEPHMIVQTEQQTDRLIETETDFKQLINYLKRKNIPKIQIPNKRHKYAQIEILPSGVVVEKPDKETMIKYWIHYLSKYTDMERSAILSREYTKKELDELCLLWGLMLNKHFYKKMNETGIFLSKLGDSYKLNPDFNYQS